MGIGAKVHKIYVCYIRPILEYASVARCGSNVTRNEADQLQTFQRRAACFIVGIPLFASIDYSELLVEAGLPMLESRRELAGVCTCSTGTPFTRKVPSHLRKVNLPKRTTIIIEVSKCNQARWHPIALVSMVTAL